MNTATLLQYKYEVKSSHLLHCTNKTITCILNNCSWRPNVCLEAKDQQK